MKNKMYLETKVSTCTNLERLVSKCLKTFGRLDSQEAKRFWAVEINEGYTNYIVLLEYKGITPPDRSYNFIAAVYGTDKEAVTQRMDELERELGLSFIEAPKLLGATLKESLDSHINKAN